MPPMASPYTFKKTQPSKRGDAQGIPSSSSTIIRSSPLKLCYYHFTYYVCYSWSFILFCFQFVLVCFLVMYFVGSQLSCVGERHAPLFHQNTLVLRLYFVEYSQLCFLISSCALLISCEELSVVAIRLSYASLIFVQIVVYGCLLDLLE